MGPMAEAFHEEFGLGNDEERIASVDSDGVALAAIQGLSKKLEEKADRIDELEAKNETLRERVERIETQLTTMGTEQPPAARDDD
jgi:chromosome segregation ATPase